MQVQALVVYLACTVLQARAIAAYAPVFISLQRPFCALTSQDIGEILGHAIEEAGLDRKQYSPKCFHPTGATQAIAAGANPDQVQALGHWASSDTFKKQYVHSVPELQMTDKILGLSGKGK